MANRIELLPDHVANQIAAGEVVQRPASVVKELLENAIDAGAQHIKLIVKDGGKTLIQVIDDGQGMTTSDARMCFERHATSKIRKAEDLFELTTKGFRGEALASIAAIAQVRLRTKTKDDELGTEISIDGSEVQDQQAVATEIGCSLAVKNLFYNIPARRNFLKSDAVELRHIIDEFQRVVLVHFDLGFSFYNNDDLLFQLEPTNMRQRIVQVFGKNTNEKLVPVDETTDVVQLKGFVYKPEFSKKSRQQQFFFVNNRFVKSPYMHHAILSAFDGLLAPNMQPGYIVYINVPPQTIDINIHPTKTEVKFEDDHTLYAILRSALKHSLGQFSIAPSLDFEHSQELDVPVGSPPPKRAPRVEVDSDFNPFKNAPQPQQSWASLYEGLENVSIPSSSSSLFENETLQHHAPTFQFRNKYIISTTKSGLLMMHQGRAHRRVLYESLLQQIDSRSVPAQMLAFPIHFSMNQSTLSLFLPHQKDLELMGFAFGEIDAEGLEITAVHSSITVDQIPAFLESLLDDLQHQPKPDNQDLKEYLAKIASKFGSIRSGVELHAAAQTGLIDDLFACQTPDRCPDGTPIFVILTSEQIDKKFHT